METIEEPPSWTCIGCDRHVEGGPEDEWHDLPDGWTDNKEGELICPTCRDEMAP